MNKFRADFKNNVVEPILTKGQPAKEEALEAFKKLTEEHPVEACELMLYPPPFNGIVSQVDFMSVAITPQSLKQVPPETLNKQLENVLRTVCFEGNSKQGFPILDMMVEAGARLDGEKFLGKEQKNRPNNSHFYVLSFLPRLNEKLETPGEVVNYVNRLTELDSIKYGNTITRGDLDKTSQWANSVKNNPIAPKKHDAFKPR